MSELALARAVVHLALNDACAEWLPRDAKKRGTMERPSNYEVAQACAFWADETGEWAAARHLWIDAAGMEPDAVRVRALRQIAAARGSCIVEVQGWREHLEAKSGRYARRALAERILSHKEQTGASYKQLIEQFGLSGREELRRFLWLAKVTRQRAEAKQ